MNADHFRASALPAVLVATLLASSGCASNPTGVSSAAPAKPNFGPTIQDVRTEATIQAMEQDYNAAKNSRPTHQYEAELEAARKAKAKQQEEAAKAAEKNEPEAKP